jgi:hypothetical protein
MRQGYLKKDQQERFNTKRGWFVKAYRIVDASGRDIVQPWFSSKKEARETALYLNIKLIEDKSAG